MQPAAPRTDEAGSLQALAALQVLDSPPEAEFDALVQAASLLCGVPIAMLSLVDHRRQWFKAAVGLHGVTETPRDVAFCAHAVLDDAVFEVIDAAQDPRFADNPMVAGPLGVRFYAGAPIQLRDGHRVGTLCLIDHQPRQLTDVQREALRCLARVAAHALEGRRAMHQAQQAVADSAQAALVLRHSADAIARSEDRLRRLYETTPAMLHTVDPQGRLTMVSDAWLARLGYARAEVLGRCSVEFFAPASRDFALAVSVPTLLAQGRHDEVECQLVARSGQVIDVLLSAIVERGADGHPLRILAGLQDVTLRRRAERALEEERQRLHNILEGTRAGTWEWHLPTGALHCNERWAALLGETLAELGPLSIHDCTDRLHPDDVAPVNHLMAEHFAGRSPHYEFEPRLRHRDGHWVWLLARGRVMRWTADGQPEWMFGTVQDISARKQQEQALRKSEDLLDRTGRLAGVGGWEIDIASGDITWSAETRRIHGVAADYRPVLASAIAFFAPDARPVIQAAVGRGLATGEPWDLELPFIPADGRAIWVRAVGAVERLDGQPVRLVGAVQDITARKQLERRLTDNERYLSQVMEASPLGMFVAQASGRCLFTNAAWQRIAGVDGSACLGDGWHMATHPQDRAQAVIDWRRAIASGQPVASEHRYQRPDGTVVWVWVHMAPIGRDSGDGIGGIGGDDGDDGDDGNGGSNAYSAGVVGTVEDITGRRLLAQSLAERSTELARSNEDLERFAYVASHDLQEPLRMVTSYGQLLARRYQAALPAEAQEFLQFMVDGGQRAQALIRDLLSLARIDSLPRARQAVPLESVLTDALRQLRLRVQDAGATITHDALPTVQADLRQMGQLLTNLISNALKFRGASAPAIHLAATREAGAWRISVRDNGLGIEARFFDRIFVMFQRLHLRSAHEGTGIGLAICKRVVERHGGRIGVESTPGQGSTFWFVLPDAAGAPQADAPLHLHAHPQAGPSAAGSPVV